MMLGLIGLDEEGTTRVSYHVRPFMWAVCLAIGPGILSPT